jgi:condensin-2 complex subunit D3
MLSQRINEAAGNEKLTQTDLIALVPSIFFVGEVMAHIANLADYDFTGLQLFLSEGLPNGVAIPAKVRAIAAIALGKLCLWRRDVATSFVSAFTHQLHQPDHPSVKCNCLVVLCDLCVKWSATVDPYVLDLTICFADGCPTVRRQALLIMTRLISEDYVKLCQLIVFRFIFSLADGRRDVAAFAQSCFFDVICVKETDLISQYFIDSMLYFNDHVDSRSINEDTAYHDAFRLPTVERRRAVYALMISHMSSSALFKLMQASCVRLLQSFVEGEIELDEGEPLLSDTIHVMTTVEAAMASANATDANTDDPHSEHIVAQSRIYLGMIHDQLIQRVLPILNQTHRFLRERRSPLQSPLRKFFRALCARHPDLLDEVKRQEPLLGAELESEIVRTQTPGAVETAETFRTPFRSPLLAKIARTPVSASAQRTAPVTWVVPGEGDGKQPPVPFRLDDG